MDTKQQSHFPPSRTAPKPSPPHTKPPKPHKPAPKLPEKDGKAKHDNDQQKAPENVQATGPREGPSELDHTEVNEPPHATHSTQSNRPSVVERLFKAEQQKADAPPLPPPRRSTSKPPPRSPQPYTHARDNSDVAHNSRQQHDIVAPSTPPKRSSTTQNIQFQQQHFHDIGDGHEPSTSKQSSADSHSGEKKKKMFGLFKRKDKSKGNDFEISEPTGFNAVIKFGNETNPFEKFEGKDEVAIYPMKPPITMLNKRDIGSPQEYFDLIMEMNRMQLLFDDWSSPVVPIEKWLMNYPPGWEQSCLISPDSIKNGYCIETGKDACTRDTLLNSYLIVDITSDFCFFERCIAHNPDAEHYILTNEPTVLSIIPGTNGGFRRGVVMNKKGSIRCLIPNEVTNIKEFKWAFPDTSRGLFFKVTNKEKFENEVVRYEKMSAVTHYKFGVLYCKKNQTNEDDMFGNTEGCPAYEKFLDLLGQKIELNGFEHYRGGLDVKFGSTGTYSYYTEYLCYEVMFHVSTLLPEQPGDLQRVEKKRHIGNDVVVIIFKENSNDPNDKFDPRWLTSQFNHVFIVVQPDRNDSSNNGYTINVGCKSSVNPFPPFMVTSHFNHDEATREFILRKAVNGERTAMFSVAFKGTATKTRRDQLKFLIEACE